MQLAVVALWRSSLESAKAKDKQKK